VDCGSPPSLQVAFKVDGTSQVDRRAMGSGKEGYQALATASISRPRGFDQGGAENNTLTFTAPGGLLTRFVQEFVLYAPIGT